MITAKLKLPFIHPLILIVVFLFISPGNIRSQVNDCSFFYYNAINLYKAGKVDTAYSLLNSCLMNRKLFKRTSRSIRSDIYHLSALTSILLDKPNEAILHTSRFLTYEPYYKNNFQKDDLLEFRKIVTEFTVQPRIVLGLNYFIDFSKFKLEKIITSHTASYTPRLYSWSESGFGLTVDYSFSKNIVGGLGINLLYISFMYDGSPMPFSGSYSTYYAPLRFLETPLLICYKMRIRKKIIPYVHTRIIGRYYLSSGTQKYESSEYGTFYNVRNQGNLAIFFKNFENLDFQIGVGSIYSFKKSCFDLNISFCPMWINTNPLKDINNADDLPNYELFSRADEIIVVDQKKFIRLSFSYKYYLSYKSF